MELNDFLVHCHVRDLHHACFSPGFPSHGFWAGRLYMFTAVGMHADAWFGGFTGMDFTRFQYDHQPDVPADVQLGPGGAAHVYFHGVDAGPFRDCREA